MAAENLGNLPPDAEALAFGDQLARHLVRGARPTGFGEVWTNKSFAHAVGVTPRTLRNWLSGAAVPHDLRAIERALFGDNPVYEVAKRELREGWAQAKSKERQVNTVSLNDGMASSSTDVGSTYRDYVRNEFEQIKERTSNLKHPVLSSSRVRIFGWLYSCALGDTNLFAHGIEKEPSKNPRIAAVELKIKYRNLLSSRVEHPQYRKRVSIDNTVSFRYLLYCFCVAAGIVEFDEATLFGSLVRGLRSPSTNIDTDYYALGEEIELLIAEPVSDATLVRCGKVLYLLGTLAGTLSITEADLFKEETLPHRSGARKRRQSEIEERNAITHEVEIYFVDHQDSYFELFRELRNESRFNFQRTQSETLSPERVARVTFLVNHHGSDLRHRVNEIVERNEILRSLVLALFVREL